MSSSGFSPFRAVWLRVLSALTSLALLVWSGVAPADEVHLRAPADAPELPAGSATLPAVPAGFQTADAGWLKLSYPASLAHWKKELLEVAEAFRQEVTARFGQAVLEAVHVRLAETPAQMTQLAPSNAPYPPYAAGVAYSRLGLILLAGAPLHPADDHDLRTTLRHELAHVALFDALQGHRVPLWFNEGLAIHLSRENSFARTRVLATASVSGNLLPLVELNQRFPADVVGVPLAYAQSADVVRFLLRSQDTERFRLLVARLRRGQDFEAALYDSYGTDSYNLERNWLADVGDRFSIWPVLFSGTVVWTGAVVLVTLAWRRKRQRQRVAFTRWEREDALEAARAQQRAQLLEQAAEVRAALERAAQERTTPSRPDLASSDVADDAPNASVPPTNPTSSEATASEGSVPVGVVVQAQRDSSVPKVEHDGRWHTLH